jgi:hypothetical protein
MAIIKGLKDFKSALRGGGARPNLFEVLIPTLPAAVANDPQGLAGNFDIGGFRILCKATALPGSTQGVIEIPFRGRTFKVAGDKTFETWTVTVINDEDFRHRNTFEAWMQNISQQSDHSGLSNPACYMHNAQVFQLGRQTRNGDCGPGVVRETFTTSDAGNQQTANVLAQYRFVDMFPINVSPIELSYDSSDQIEEFTVEFAYQYYIREEPTGE